MVNSSFLPVAGWSSMDAVSQVPMEVVLPKHILDIWVIVLIILATIVIMTSLLLCPATAVIIYRMRTHPVLNGAVWEPPKRGRWRMRTESLPPASFPFSEEPQEGLWSMDTGARYVRRPEFWFWFCHWPVVWVWSRDLILWVPGSLLSKWGSWFLPVLPHGVVRTNDLVEVKAVDE